MKGKKKIMSNGKILGFVVVLAIGAAASLMMEKKGDTKIHQAVGSSLLSGEAIGSIHEMTLREGDESVLLKKGEKGGWSLPREEGFAASAEKVIKLLEGLSENKIVRHVSSSKKAWEKLEIKGDKVITLKGDKGFELSLILGKNRQKGGQYLAKGGKEDTYLVEKSLLLETKSSAFWYKTLASLDKDKVKSVVFSDSLQFSREKKEASFVLKGLKDNEKLKESEIGRLAGLLSDVSFTGKDKRSQSYNSALEKARPLRIETFEGGVFTVKIVRLSVPKGDDKGEFENKYYFYVKGEKATDKLMDVWQFEISEYVANNFLKERRDFVENKSS